MALTAHAKHTTKCAQCGKPANNRCKGCLEGVNPDGTEAPATFYCGKNCQIKHRPEHKVECRSRKDRKCLYRAGELLHALFMRYREVTLHGAYSKVEKTSDGKIHVYDKSLANDHDPHRPVPTTSGMTSEDRHVVLSMAASIEVPMLMLEIVNKALKGLTSKIEELLFFSKTSLKRYVMHSMRQPFGSSLGMYFILRLTLKDGISYAIGLAGAQYGQHKPVLPYDEFSTSYPMNGWRVDPLGTFLAQSDGMRNPEKDAVMSRLDFAKMKAIVGCNTKAVGEWEEKTGMSIADLLNLEKGAFEQKSADLLDDAQKKMEVCVADGTNDGRWGY